MPPVNGDLVIADDGCPIKSELDAYKEATRVMLGFRTREEMENVFRRVLVWKAMLRLEDALATTRARRQPGRIRTRPGDRGRAIETGA